MVYMHHEIANPQPMEDTMNAITMFTANSGHVIDIRLSDPRQANLTDIPGFRARDFWDSLRSEPVVPAPGSIERNLP